MSFRKKEEWKRLLRPVCRLVFAETLLLVCSASHASCTVLNIELRIVGSNKRLFPTVQVLICEVTCGLKIV